MRGTKGRMVIRAAVCDGDLHFADAFAGRIRKVSELLGMDALVRVFEGGKDCCAAMERETFDILFLDIEMEGTGGVHAARNICFRRRDERSPALVFVSSHENRVFDLFEYEPLWFLRRDRAERELDKVLRKYMEKTARKELIYHFRNGMSYKAVKIRDILYLECSGHTVEINTSSQWFSVYGSLKRIEDELKPYGFFRIHRNYLVNMNAVFSVDKNTVTLVDYSVLPLSREKKQKAKEMLFMEND